MLTVNEAIRKGQRLINLPIAIFMIAGMLVLIFLDNKKVIPSWVTVVGSVFVFLTGWLYWSFAITKWRLWAFKNVDNPHELRQRAVAEKLIWKKGSIFEKTEIRTPAEKKEWGIILKTKFREEEQE